MSFVNRTFYQALALSKSIYNWANYLFRVLVNSDIRQKKAKRKGESGLQIFCKKYNK